MPEKPITSARFYRRQALDKVIEVIQADEKLHHKRKSDTWSEVNAIERQTDLLLRVLSAL